MSAGLQVSWLRSELAGRQQLAALAAWGALAAARMQARDVLHAAVRKIWLRQSFAAWQRRSAMRRLLWDALRAWRAETLTLARLSRAARNVAAAVRLRLLARTLMAWRAWSSLVAIGHAVAARRRRQVMKAALAWMRKYVAAQKTKRCLADRAERFRQHRLLYAFWW